MGANASRIFKPRVPPAVPTYEGIDDAIVGFMSSTRTSYCLSRRRAIHSRWADPVPGVDLDFVRGDLAGRRVRPLQLTGSASLRCGGDAPALRAVEREHHHQLS